MTLPRIVQAGDPVLRAGTPDIARDSFSVIEEVAEVMVETMRAAPGVGLAAPQIGLSLRLAVIEDREEDIELMPPDEMVRIERTPLTLGVLVNPSYQPRGDR